MRPKVEGGRRTGRAAENRNALARRRFCLPWCRPGSAQRWCAGRAYYGISWLLRGGHSRSHRPSLVPCRLSCGFLRARRQGGRGVRLRGCSWLSPLRARRVVVVVRGFSSRPLEMPHSFARNRAWRTENGRAPRIAAAHARRCYLTRPAGRMRRAWQRKQHRRGVVGGELFKEPWGLPSFRWPIACP